MKTVTVTLPPFGTLIASQGGHLAAIMRGADDMPYALLVAPKDSEIERCAWGEYGKDVKAAGSRTDGKANTVAMLASDCPGATAVTQLEVGGHKDWVLPAIGQLNAAAANVPELFEANGIYWSSTQDSRLSALAQAFEYGFSLRVVKDFEFRVRAFRTIPLDLLNA